MAVEPKVTFSEPWPLVIRQLRELGYFPGKHGQYYGRWFHNYTSHAKLGSYRVETGYYEVQDPEETRVDEKLFVLKPEPKHSLSSLFGHVFGIQSLQDKLVVIGSVQCEYRGGILRAEAFGRQYVPEVTALTKKIAEIRPVTEIDIHLLTERDTVIAACTCK